MTSIDWAHLLRKADEPFKVGCFILDPPLPLGLSDDSDDAWDLDTVLRTVAVVCGSFRPPFSIIIYSTWSMREMQVALKAHAVLHSVRLQVSEFVLMKVTPLCTYYDLL